ncbi:MAG: N-acetyl-gamma-glutamyl-phosphate reductase [Clostridia bacterium]|nr:N-acetyl-gamma-glutamyl-phosphate reductase [Clostridia bacterium]
MIKVFIDGREGTTGLKIDERLRLRDDIQVIVLPEELRKDIAARREAINSSDVTFLCLPDAAAKEAVTLVTNPKTIVIDASTAHRTAEGWAYGFAELSKEHREQIAKGKRIANPGCYASGFIALVYPLVKAGIVPKDYPFVCHAVSGYSGGGKKAIAQYEGSPRDIALDTPRLYAVGLEHKHLPEMVKVCGLERTPVFNPYICDYYNGMTVNVPLFCGLIKKGTTKETVEKILIKHYANSSFVHIKKEEGFISANALVGTNNMELFVNGNEERILLTATLDNLGKGASGAAIQNMNIALGLDERLGL